MKVLIACEESQAVCCEFRKLHHEAFSCDILPCSGGHPEWHIEGDVIPVLERDWDLIIAFPPCTFLTVTGNRWFNVEKYGDKARKRHRDREDAIRFFMALVNADCSRIACENPIGVMSTTFRKPDQIIQPWMFGHETTKATCLWLKGLPKLTPTDVVGKGGVVTAKSGNRMSAWYYETSCLPHSQRSLARSKTFQGIAEAMAKQWG